MCRGRVMKWVMAMCGTVAIAAQAAEAQTHAVLEDYAELVYRSYAAAHEDARQLQQAVQAFVNDPTQRTPGGLRQLQELWLAAHRSYGLTEAFRFYEGPIDCAACNDGQPGPELQLNAWPLNEAYIDAVIADPGIVIDRQALLLRNARDDEADVTTGYHAIEYLLWGVDDNPAGPGQRSVNDFIGDYTNHSNNHSIGNDLSARRRRYLQVSADLLETQLQALVAAWTPGQGNYRAAWLSLPEDRALAGLLTGLATLSGFELGYERLATALDSGAQEDEQSCFSDSTLNDVQANIQGVANVYFAHRDEFLGHGIQSLLRERNATLENILTTQIDKSLRLALQLDAPFDQTLLTETGSPQRQRVEALITSLQTQARLFKAAGAALGLRIAVAVDND